MTQPAKAQEPSMEEILASIRRIIADDDASKPSAVEEVAAAAAVAQPAPPAPEPRVVPPEPVLPEPELPAAPADVADQSSDILDLTESMASPMPPPPMPNPRPDPAPKFRTIDGNSDVTFDDVTAGPALQKSSEERAQLISKETSAAVDSAFNSLAQTVLVHNARTLEDLVREMLRPMLKSWLDDNLPALVERLVRTEIERVSRGR